MLLALLALQASAIAVGGALEATACKPCHEQIVATFLQTAHVVTSAEAAARSIKGRFAAGHNVLRTRSPGVSFRMEERNGAFYETGVDSAQVGTLGFSAIAALLLGAGLFTAGRSRRKVRA